MSKEEKQGLQAPASADAAIPAVQSLREALRTLTRELTPDVPPADVYSLATEASGKAIPE